MCALHCEHKHQSVLWQKRLNRDKFVFRTINHIFVCYVVLKTKVKMFSCLVDLTGRKYLNKYKIKSHIDGGEF